MATTVLGLKTFAASDPVDYNEINDNYNKIDSGVKTALQGRAAHNLLDNSNFQINQRGITSTEASGYHVDRWKKENSSGKVTVGNGYLSMTGTGAYWFLTQFVPTNKIKSGAVYTIALADTSGSVGVCSTVMSTDMTKFTARHTFTSGAVVAINVEYTSDKYALYFTSNSSAETRFAWVALYEGSYTANTLPDYQPKGYAAELAECQRQYIIVRRYRPAVATFVDSTQSLMIFDVQLPQRMRIKPTATIKKFPSYIRINGQQYSFTDLVISATYYNKDENTIGIVLKCTSNFGSFMTGHFDEIAIEFSSEM